MVCDVKKKRGGHQSKFRFQYDAILEEKAKEAPPSARNDILRWSGQKIRHTHTDAVIIIINQKTRVEKGS